MAVATDHTCWWAAPHAPTQEDSERPTGDACMLLILIELLFHNLFSSDIGMAAWPDSMGVLLC